MRYEYETSPRKYEEYDKPKKKKRKNTSKTKTSKSKTSKAIQEKKAQRREKAKFRFMIFVNVIMILAIMFTIIYRNALISQTFSEKEALKAQISELQKENDQLEISIQNNLNLSSIEQTAKDLLGMQKLTSKQTIYLTLPKKDYVEPSTEEVVIEEDIGIMQRIMNFIKGIF